MSANGPIENSNLSVKLMNSAAELTDELLTQLSLLLVDSVKGNYSVGFMDDSTYADYSSFWISEFNAILNGNMIQIAFLDQSAVGTVILTRENRANGKHRAELRKLMVHSQFQNLGIGTRLEQAATELARANGIELLYLDSATDFLVAGKYEKWGWVKVGEIPRYARNPDGSFVSTWFFYKDLRI